MINNSGHGLNDVNNSNIGDNDQYSVPTGDSTNQNGAHASHGYGSTSSNSNIGSNVSSNYAKDTIINSQSAQGSIKINNTTITIKPNSGKIDLKLFVGQIPKDWDERHVTDFFSKYGEILESQIIRDSRSGQSKGCAFVKFASMTNAEDAIKHLTSKEAPVHLPGVANPIQLRWADGEEQRLGLGSIDVNSATKLFVGSIPKHATEDNLRDVFEPFGKIEELMLIKETDGSSKGCAFLKYELKESSILAIRSLNASAYILDHDKPLEVRFAENRKKTPAPSTGGYSGGTHPSHGHYGGPQSQPPGPYSNMYPSWGGSNYYQQQPPQQVFIRYHDTASGAPYYFNTQTQKTQWEEPQPGSLVYCDEWGNAPYVIKPNVDYNKVPPTMGGDPNIPQPGVKRQGPSGANLFVFHLPNEWRDPDLYMHFQRFGNIISYRIMTDKTTGRSRGFGFVSYDNPASSKMAIDAMNGFQVGNKRLKVSIKKSDEEHAHDPNSHQNSANMANMAIFKPY